MDDLFCSSECLKSDLQGELDRLATTCVDGPAITLATLRKMLERWVEDTTDRLPWSLLYPVQRDVSTPGVDKDLNARFLLGEGNLEVDARRNIQFFFSLYGEDIYNSDNVPPLSLLELVPRHRMVLEALRRVSQQANVQIMLSCMPQGPLLEGNPVAAPGRMYVDIFGHELSHNKAFPRQEILIKSDNEVDSTKHVRDGVDWVSLYPIKSCTELL